MPQGQDVGDQLEVLLHEAGDVPEGADYVSLAKRIEQLKAWAAAQPAAA